MKIRKCIFFVVVIAATLGLAGLSAAQSEREVTLSQARQLAADKNYPESIALYKELLSNNPDDIEAMLGLAAVTVWSGDYEEAKRLYEEILLKDPGNSEAMIGTARIHYWQKDYELGLARLDEFASAFPGNIEGIELRSKIMDAKRVDRRFKIRSGFKYEQISFTSNAPGANFIFSYREPKKFEVRAGFDYINKYGDSAPGYFAGASFWATKDTVLIFDTQFAPKQYVVPKQSYTFGITQRLYDGLVGGAFYRFMDYREANVHMIIPEITWYFHPRFNWLIRYYMSVTQARGENLIDNSGMTKLSANPVDWLVIFGGYAYASESFDPGNPINPFSGFKAGHIFAGFEAEVYRGFGVDFIYDFEKRDNEFTISTYNVGLFYNW